MGNNNQNQGNRQQQKRDDKYHISVKDPASFLDRAEKYECHMTSREFCETIVNPLFKGTFKDCNGSYCSLMNTSGGPKMFVDLHFSKSNSQVSNAPYECLIEKSVALSNATDTFSRVQALNNKIKTSGIYDITKEARDILSDFNPGEKDPDKINWKQKIIETNDNSQRGIGTSAYVKIITFDPVLIVKNYFGKYIKVNGKVTDRIAEYNVEVVKQIQNVYNPHGGVDLLLKISCYDRKNAEKSIMASGSFPQYTLNPMYTACNNI